MFTHMCASVRSSVQGACSVRENVQLCTWLRRKTRRGGGVLALKAKQGDEVSVLLVLSELGLCSSCPLEGRADSAPSMEVPPKTTLTFSF